MSLWAEQHQPRSESELVIQKKKVQDVREFLVAGTRRLLVLHGPPGSGKAAALHGVCGDLGLEVVEWTAATVNRSSSGGTDGSLFREPLGDAFLRFLAQADRYRGLAQASGAPVLSNRRRVALVRDFPFTLIDRNLGKVASNAAPFLDRFSAMVRQGTVQRAVLCFNDSREDHILISKLTADVDPAVVQVLHFDTVARTFVQKALDAVSRSHGLEPASAGTASIAAECGGDLRHAINALQLANGWRAANGCAASSSAPRATGRGRSKKAAQPLEVSANGLAGDKCMRAASMGFFHALGRLLYNKRIPPAELLATSEPSAKRRKKDSGAEPRQLPHEFYLPKCSRPSLYFVPEDVLESSNTEPEVTVDWLFTNAPRFYGDIEDLAEFAETLADVDAWHSSSRMSRNSIEVDTASWRSLAPAVQTRAVLDANVHPVPPSFSDPGNMSQRSTESPAFNMIKPLMRDMEKQRQLRFSILNANLEAVGPVGLGCSSPSSSLVRQTLPYVDQMLRATRGAHPRLRHLPHSLMKLNMELSEFKGAFPKDGTEGESLLPGANVEQADWSAVPSDDPIELFDS